MNMHTSINHTTGRGRSRGWARERAEGEGAFALPE